MDKETLIKVLKQKDDMLKALCLEKEKLTYYANTDTMTEVLNRRAGLELLERKLHLSKTCGESFVVCFVDVDRLKLVNDTFGHEEGDKLLVNAAKIIRGSIRETDLVIRMGGDEFLIVFHRSTMKEANKLWYRISKNVEELNKNNDKYDLSLSCGFCEYRKEMNKEISINDLIKKADMEMYKRKMTKRRNFRDMCLIK
ncbi:GGDEF domain-containing protein [Clostridium beijerinckii]|nr:GGDEF domain-containing protein [Clostridium beijerinckii]